ncbi:APC family permease [Kribbella sp. NBC_01484]|uniref:APC family permease n=1 Tax=Kribbella sp. NBC_01484 TaxID=2903579 RepID=UPI002E364F18|nr:APC family permease [Kribbella sp. NBC_01484]
MAIKPNQPPSSDARPPDARLTLRGAVFLGIGAMVGAGIFALLGEAGAIAGSAVWISFLAAGVVSLALGYAMAKMGTRYPSSGGLITYLIHGFGNGRLVGVAAWLGYLTAIVVVGAMVAVSFGEYASAIVVGDNNATGWTKLFASAMVLATTFLCIIGPRTVDRAQSVIVIALLAVFAIFVVVTLTHLDTHLLAPSGYPSVNSIVSSIALTFFAYLGFAVISFTGGDLENPRRNLPRAMYVALGVTTVLYVAIALGVFGTLTVSQVVEFGPTAIAEAVRPTLGDAGFAAMAIAALLATASSVTATLYASEGLTSALADVGQFPTVFGKTSRLGPHGGLWITTVATLLFVNVFDLGALASIGSAVSLAVFVLVGVAAIRLRHTIGANLAILLAGVIFSIVVLVVFAVDTYGNDPKAFWTMILLPVLALVLDAVWKHRDAGTAPAAGGEDQRDRS